MASKPEKRKRGKRSPSILDRLPKNLPSLTLASRISERVSEVGFDWPNLKGVMAKLEEEMEELREALASANRKRIQEEIGDLLFVMVNLARWAGIDPEKALKGTIKKFLSRFRYIERSFRKSGRSLAQSDLAEMEELWEASKARSSNRMRR